MHVSPSDVTANLVAGVATDAISAAAVHSHQLIKKVLRWKETKTRLRQVEAAVGGFPSDIEDQVRAYLGSQSGRKIITSLAYLAVLGDIDGKRAKDLGEIFAQEVKRSCPQGETATILGNSLNL